MIYFTDYIFDLVQNSIKAEAKNILISLDFGQQLIFRLEDDGKGMSQEILEKVKDFTYSTQKNRKVGLGLSMIHDLTKQTEGTFDIKSTLGIGTLLELSFNHRHIDFPDVGNIGLMISDIYINQFDINVILDIKYQKNYTFDLLDFVENKDFSYKVKKEIEQTINNEIKEIRVDYENFSRTKKIKR
jgi:Histidine kinase-, DNA gyrase B-, and HSP90-like ATPase